MVYLSSENSVGPNSIQDTVYGEHCQGVCWPTRKSRAALQYVHCNTLHRRNCFRFSRVILLCRECHKQRGVRSHHGSLEGNHIRPLNIPCATASVFSTVRTAPAGWSASIPNNDTGVICFRIRELEERRIRMTEQGKDPPHEHPDVEQPCRSQTRRPSLSVQTIASVTLRVDVVDHLTAVFSTGMLLLQPWTKETVAVSARAVEVHDSHNGQTRTASRTIVLLSIRSVPSIVAGREADEACNLVQSSQGQP